ncbi:E3 ubiquitin-protein ligase makorin-like isoform X2 [Quercus lobata]|uniref:E3 ubiquitin-protein ligase makorin-like isoform X2 n=1 Tax=Quercus lobata TaxID=97700 RepID=UPI0012447E02|nr:E3 ubiquitin-protein ligase makorin-like isoform X2 [Quercus lobata]
MIGRILHITFAPIVRKDFVHVVVVADMNMLKLLEAILLLHLHQQMHAKCMSKFLKVSIDCKHFDFGNGNRPFGSSCFYKHAYRDGCLEEVVLRHLGSEDGEIVIAKNIRLSEFLGNMRIR